MIIHIGNRVIYSTRLQKIRCVKMLLSVTWITIGFKLLRAQKIKLLIFILIAILKI